MPNVCPECGAVLTENTTCQSIFDSFLALEFTDPAYGEVHLLTVACYMIHHGRYSDEALRWIEGKLRDYLDKGIPIEEIRRGAARETGQHARAWRVTRQPGAPQLPKIAWSMTIADVAMHAQDAASYRQWVKRWTSITLREMKAWLSDTG